MPRELLIRYLFSFFPMFMDFLYISRIGFIECFLKVNKFLFFFLKFLKSSRFFLLEVLVDLVGIDFVSLKDRFHVVYNFLSLRNFFRFFVHLKTIEILQGLTEEEASLSLFSLVSIYLNASWLEREVWDLYGIFFRDNPDLRRILTDYGFEGFPLRKDFPLTGFVEVRYDEEVKSVVYDTLELTQEFRFFDFESPWKDKSYGEIKNV